MLRYKLILKKWAPYIVAGLAATIALYAMIMPSLHAGYCQGAPVCDCYDVAPDLVKCDCAQDMGK